ncbi:MAG: hypothetical protein KDA38_04040 [Planctomycetales bacterium]|nr:hypothetical protein [Planctomycetales bacterium]
MHSKPVMEAGGGEQLRHLAHELHGHLSVVSLGLELLEGVRDDEDQFREVLTMIRSDGLGPLKATVAALLKNAREVQQV